MEKRQENEPDMFELQVAAVMELRGYSVKRDRTVAGTQIDLVAKSKDDFNDLTYLIECNSSKNRIGIGIIKEKAGILASQKKKTRLIFVSFAGFTRHALEFAETIDRFQLITLAELERSLLDLRGYLNWIVTQFEKSEGMFSEAMLEKFYVPLRCETQKKKDTDLFAFTENWANSEKSGNILFLLGDYGRGKTSFVRFFTYSVCKRIRDKKTPTYNYIPILVNLRSYRRNQNLERIILDMLYTQYGVRIDSFSHFQRFWALGKIVLILDGFDEMIETTNPDDIKFCFDQIYSLGAIGSKILITCRTSFFSSNQEIVKLLNSFSISIAELLEDTDLQGEVDFNNLAQIIEVRPFDDKDIFVYLNQRFGKKATTVLKDLRKIHDLSDLSTRPVLLDIICDTLPRLLERKGRANSAVLYDYYTRRWSRRDEWRTKLSERERHDFCEALAWLSHLSQIEIIDISLIRDCVEFGLRGASESEPELLGFLADVKYCSFLTRSGSETSYRFAHNSFREYFVARRLISELIGGTCPSSEEAENFLQKRDEKRELEKNREIQLRKQSQERKKKKADAKNRKPIVKGQKFGQAVVAEGHDIWINMDLGDAIQLRRPGRIIRETHTNLVETHDNLLKYVRKRTFPLISGQQHRTENIENILKEVFELPINETLFSRLNISEEIAGFAIEILTSQQINIIDFLLGLVDSDEKNVFLSLLKNANHPYFYKAYFDTLIPTLTRNEVWWAKDFSVLFGEFGPKLPDGAIIEIGKIFGADLHHFLYALIRSPEDYRNSFSTCFEGRNATALQKSLISYGQEHLIVQNAADLFSEDFLKELIVENSLDVAERQFVFDVLGVAKFSVRRMVSFISKQIKSIKSVDGAKWLLNLIGSIDHPDKMKVIRGLRVNEDRNEVRKALNFLEKQVLDYESEKRHEVTSDDRRDPNTKVQ